MSSLRTPVLEADGLTKVYPRGREQLRALDGVSFQVAQGEFVALVGPSGAGKTTLMNLVGCMDSPTSGTLKIAGESVANLSDAGRTRLRQRHIGFVFQHFGLVPTLTVAENVALPTVFAGSRNPGRVAELLDQVGLTSRRGHRPHELSGGEMQRVAIARALVNSPSLLLADEPTGNLDSSTGDAIIELFRQLNARGLTILTVTHNSSLAAAARRELRLRDGRLQMA